MKERNYEFDIPNEIKIEKSVNFWTPELVTKFMDRDYLAGNPI